MLLRRERRQTQRELIENITDDRLEEDDSMDYDNPNHNALYEGAGSVSFNDTGFHSLGTNYHDESSRIDYIIDIDDILDY